MKPYKIITVMLCILSLPAAAYDLADAPADDPLAPAMVRCLKDKGCKAGIERMIPAVSNDAKISPAEARKLIGNCDADDMAKSTCLRFFVGSLDDKLKRVTNRLLDSADAACRTQVVDARKAWRFRIDNACEAAAGDTAGRYARIANCRALALQRRVDKLERLNSCTPCAPCIDP